jgi:hypothetical protein
MAKAFVVCNERVTRRLPTGDERAGLYGVSASGGIGPLCCLLRKRVSELGDAHIGRIQTLCALVVELKALFVKLDRLVEIQGGVLKLVGDGLEALERGLYRPLSRRVT